FQDWAKREAARASEGPGHSETAGGPAADGGGQPQRNPPRNWAAPPPWLTRAARDRGGEPPPGSLWADEDGEAEPPAQVEPFVPRRGRGLSGSYADQVASDSAGSVPGGILDDEDAAYAPLPPIAPAVPAPRLPAPVAHVYHVPMPEDDEVAATSDEPPPRVRRRERDLVRDDRPGGQDRQDHPEARRGGPAPEWERARPLEAYPTIRSRRLSELSIPPILVAVVALALAAAVLFALPSLLGFGGQQAGASASPSVPVQTAIPSVNPTAVPQPTAQIYLVQSGDTMSRIAGRFGIPLNDLIAANTQTVPNPNKLQIGQEIIIPAQAVVPASVIPGAT
ncbi:MAG: LysM peptidoglycan-binding domain-containing protein, partial [Gemmatimonadales bacterium]